MRFVGLDPRAAAALVALAILVALAAVWRRPLWRRVEVAFAAAWARAFASSRRTLPWRELIAAFLFVGAIGGLGAALAGPRRDPRPPRRVAIVLDASGTMRARDADGVVREDAARALAARLARSKRAGDVVEIFRAGAEILPLAPWQLDGALPADASLADARVALAAARAFLDGRVPGVDAPERHLVVLSDRPERFPGDDVERVGVGGAAENLFLSDLGVFALAPPARGYEIRVEVENGGDSAGSADIVLHTDRYRVGAAPISVAPGARETRAFRVDALPSTELWASLDGARFASGRADALPDDDRRVVRAPPPDALRVVLVTKGNRFLEGALAAQPSVAVTLASPEAPLPDADVVIFDRVPPEPAPRARGVLVVDSPKTGEPAAPVLSDWNPRHPATRKVSLDDLTLASAHAVAAGEGDTVLAGIDAGPIAVAREHGEHREVELGFDPTRSDFPLRLAFPVFVGETVRWLGGRESPGRSAPSGSTGVAIPIAVPPDAALLATLAPGASAPAGAAARLAARGDGSVLVANEPGLYRAANVEAAI
ncbi:MAG TPA: hypothetical protein VMV18_13125, partial [bacterium]|nr:hypothetical protein [bacterium]